MTDSAQAEIDKILRRLVNRVEQYAFEKWDSQPKDYPPGFRDVLFTQDMEDEAAEALLDWHNKQTEEVLDRLLEHGEDFTTFGDGGLSVAVEYIEAERKRINKIGKT